MRECGGSFHGDVLAYPVEKDDPNILDLFERMIVTRMAEPVAKTDA